MEHDVEESGVDALRRLDKPYRLFDGRNGPERHGANGLEILYQFEGQDRLIFNDEDVQPFVSGALSPRCVGLPGKAGRRTAQAAALSPGMVG